MKNFTVSLIVVLMLMFGIVAVKAGEQNGDEQLFKTKCSACHSDEIPLHMKKDRKAWEETVKRMQQKRPNFISDKDAQKIIDFLVSNSKKEK
ncbi:MAG: hypothetical protein ACP5JP_10655 [bacterium]